MDLFMSRVVVVALRAASLIKVSCAQSDRPIGVSVQREGGFSKHWVDRPEPELKPACIKRRTQKGAEMFWGLVADAVATVGRLVTAFTDVFTDMFLTPPLKATLRHLEETELKTLQAGQFTCEMIFKT